MATFLLLLSAISVLNGHMKFVYPPPRDESTAIKNGPCGNQGFDVGDVTSVAANSTLRVEIIETIHHVGAPYRIALSHVSNDSYSDCILLNHIPQHTQGENAKLFIDIQIPDVACPMCALQIVSFMTDKIGKGNTCQYLADGKSGSCFSNYHSCANVKIEGKIDRKDLICEQPEKWPYKDLVWDMYTQEESEKYWTVLNIDPPVQLELITNGGDSSNETYTSMPSTSPTETGTSAANDGFVQYIFVLLLCFSVFIV